MSQNAEDLQKQWDAFLERWPLEKLSEMTLEEYTGNQKIDFVYDLGHKTDQLGSITGNTAFKFGIYRQSEPKEERKGNHVYGGDYAWQVIFGDDVASAFEAVRLEVVQIAEAASQGRYEDIENSRLFPVYKWKIAFLYQDQTRPGVLNIFSKRILEYLARKNNLAWPDKINRIELYNQLILKYAATTGHDLLTASRHLMEHWSKRKIRQATWLIPLDGMTEPLDFARSKNLKLFSIPAWIDLEEEIEIEAQDWLVLSEGKTVIARGRITEKNNDILSWSAQIVRRPLPGKKGFIRKLDGKEHKVIWPVKEKVEKPIINKIRIQHFRSIKDLTIASCRDLNIISGCNDVGKSNILRALHLFFNGDADWWIR